MLATQNPIEQEGTYPLPEAQVDRFMLKLKIGYPSRAEERQILDLMARTSGTPTPAPVVEPEQILHARQVINDIYVDDKVKDYIVDLVCATREPEAYKIQVKEFIQLGASPRATIYLTLAAKAYAFLQGPRLRDAAGREEHRHGRAAPPRRHHLRGRGRGEDQRDRSSRRSSTSCRCHDSPRDSQEDPADRDSHQPAGERDAGGPVPQRLQGPGDELRRGARISARRRGALHRLERHRADEPSVRQEVRRGTRADADAGGGCQRLGPVRLARAVQARAGGGDRLGAGLLRHPQQRQGGADPVHRRGREVHPAAQRPPARAARHPRGPLLRAAAARHGPERRAGVPAAGHAAPGHRGGDLGLSSARRRSGAAGAAASCGRR